MNWLQITIDVAAGQMERLTALLTAHGYEDLVIEDQAADAKPEAPILWPPDAKN